MSVSLARFSSALAITAAMLSAARGASLLYWDGDATGAGNSVSGTGLGGDGTWDTGTSNWWNGAATSDTTWSSSSTAVFTGTAGNVLLGASQTAANLVFNTDGYTLNASAPANTLNLAAGGAISLADPTGAPVNATINAKLSAGSSLRFNGNNGSLTLGYAGTYDGLGSTTLELHSGTLRLLGKQSVLPNTTSLKFQGSGVFRYDNVGFVDTTTTLSQSLNAATFSAGEGVLNIERTEATDAALTVATYTRDIGATALFRANGNTAGFGVNSFFNLTNVPANSFVTGAFLEANGGAATFAWKDSGGYLRPVNYGGDTGTLSLSPQSGNILGGALHYQLTGTSTHTGTVTTTIQSLSINSVTAANLTLANGFVLQIAAGGSGPGTFLRTGGSSTTVSGSATITASGTDHELILRADDSADSLTFASGITIGSSTAHLVKSGGGVVTIQGTNASASTTYVNGGRLSLVGAQAFGTGTSVFLNDGIYELLNNSSVTTNKSVVVNGTSTIRVGQASGTGTGVSLSFVGLSIGNQVLTIDPVAGYTVAFSGSTTLNDDLPTTFEVTGTQTTSAPGLTLSGTVTSGTNTPGFVKRGTGTLALTGSNNFSGTVEVQGGVLSVNSNAALGDANNRLVLNGSGTNDGLYVSTGFTTSRSLTLSQASNVIEVAAGTLTWDGLISGGDPAGFVKKGAGALKLTNAGNTFGGANSVIELRQGSLEIANAGALGNPANTLQLTTTAASILAGSDRFTVSGTATTLAQSIILAGTTTATFNLFEVAAGKLTLNGPITSPSTLSNLTKIGAGDLELNSALSTFGGTNTVIDIQGGSLIVSNGNALGDPANTVKLSYPNVSGERFQATGTGIAPQNIILATGGANPVTFEVTSGNTFSLGGTISNSGTNTYGIVKVGAGTLILDGNNLTGYGGAGKTTELQEGILSVSADTALGNTSTSVTLNSGTNVAIFQATGSFTSNRTFNLMNTGGTGNNIEVQAQSTVALNQIFGGNITAGASLIKTGLGTLTLVAANTTWNGSVTVNAGAIRVSAATGLGLTSPGTTINGQGGLEFTGIGTIVNESITINTSTDGTTLVGPGYAGVLRSVVLNATPTLNGPVTVNGLVNNGSTRGILIGADASTTFNVSSTITFDNHSVASGTMNLALGGESTTSRFSGSVSSPGAASLNLVKTGGGKWTLDPVATNSFGDLDGLTVRSGSLFVNATATGAVGGSLLPSIPLILAGSATFAYDTPSAATAKNQSLGALTFSSGDGIVQMSRSGSVANNTLTFASLLTQPRPTGATGSFTTTTGGTFAVNSRVVITSIPGLIPGNFIDSGIFATEGTSAAAFAWFDTGSFVRPIRYTGTPDGNTQTISSGNFPTGKHTQMTGATAITVTATSNAVSLNMAGTATLTINTGLALTINAGGTSGGLLKTGGAGTITAGTGTGTFGAGGAANELIIRTDASSDSLTIAAPIVNTGALTKSGLGTLTLNNTNNSWSGATTINGGSLVVSGNLNALSGGSTVTLNGSTATGAGSATLSILVDGDGRSSLESPIATGTPNDRDIVASGYGGITVGKFSSSGPNASALNKTIRFRNLTLGGQTFTTTVNNQYGVLFTGTTQFTEEVPPTFKVTSAATQASNVVQGLTLNGVVSSTRPVGFIKTDPGTLVLGNNSLVTPNTFGGAGAVIDIQGGFVAAGSNEALGNLANNILLNVNSSTQGFRATGTFATSRLFSLNQPSNAIDVTQGNVLTLNNSLNILAAVSTLTKNDNGVLELGDDSPVSWTGTVTINSGALRLKSAGGLGSVSAHITLSGNVGAAIQLSGNNVIYNPYPISLASTGINSGGALENVSGNNTWRGPITLTANAAIGSSAGTMTITGAVTGARNLTVGGAGDVVIATPAGFTDIGDGVTTSVALTKVGTGAFVISTPSTAFVKNVAINGGSFVIRGSGAKIGSSGTTATSAISITPGGQLTVDDRVGPATTSRIGNRAITSTGGTLRYESNAAGSTETLGPVTINGGATSIVVNRTGSGSVTLNLPPLTINGDSSLAFSGTSLGTAFNRLIIGSASGGTTPALTDSIIARAVYASGNSFDFATYVLPQALTANVTKSSDLVTLTAGNTRNLVVGQLVSNILNNPFQGIPANARISVILDATNFRITIPATVTGLAVKFDAQETGIAAVNPQVYNDANNIDTLTNTDTVLVNAFTVSSMLTASRTFNALKLDGSGLSVTSAPRNTLILDSGGLLVTGGANSIDTSALGFAAAQGIVHVNAGSTLTINSSMTGTGGFVKADGGMLVFNPLSGAIPGVGGNTALSGTLNINGGTVKLGTNTGLLNNIVAPGTALRIGPGGKLDLNGNSQLIGALLTDSSTSGAVGALGEITSGAGDGTLVFNQDTNTRSWSASITNGVGATTSLSRSGQGTFNVYSPQTYNGVTQITGGTTVLRDAGALTGTTALDLNFATLQLDNTGGSADVASRINDAADLTLRGGTLTLFGRPQRNSIETMHNLTLGGGLSTITANASSGLAATGIFTAELDFNSITRQPGGVVNFVGQIFGAASPLGVIGNNPRIVFSTAPALTNNIIGGWAITTPSGTPEFASFAPGLGIGPLGGVGFAPYDITSLSGVNASQNVRLTATAAVSASTVTVNSLNFVGNATNSITFASLTTSVLNLVTGGLIKSGGTATNTIGTAALPGKLTSGGSTVGLASELSVYHLGNSASANGLTINSQIIDNGAAGATTALVLSGSSTSLISLAPIGASGSTYHGGTTINTVTVNTSGATAATVIPAATDPTKGLVLNSAPVTISGAGQIAAANIVTLNGPSTLTLTGDNTLAGVRFNNTGGITTPTLNSTTGILTIGPNGTIDATSTNVTTTSVIAGKLALPNANARTFNIDPILFNNEQINPLQATLALQAIENAPFGIVKNGDGVLQFNTQDTFGSANPAAAPIEVNAGGIQYGALNAGSRYAPINLNTSSTWLNLNNQSTVVGSVGGSGNVTNSSNTTQNLTTGFNNLGSTLTGGVKRFSNGFLASLNVIKIGTGSMAMEGVSDSTGNLTVQGGEVKFQANGRANFANNLAQTGGTLTLDNTTTNVNDRLGGLSTSYVLAGNPVDVYSGTLTPNGGTVKIIGNSAVDTTESIAVFTVGSGAGVLDLRPNDPTPPTPGNFNDGADGRILTLNVGTTFTAPVAGGTLLIKGLAPSDPDDVANHPLQPILRGDATVVLGNLNTTVALNNPAGSGFVTKELAVRPDIIAERHDYSGGYAFVTKDAFSFVLRPLVVDVETQGQILPGSTAPTNYDFTGMQTITLNTSAYTIALQDSAGIQAVSSSAHGRYGPSGTLLTQTVIGGGILTYDDTIASLKMGLLQTANNTPLIFHVNGSGSELTVEASLNAGTGGLTKSGTGDLILKSRGYYTGVTTINEGKLILDGPLDNNNLAVVPNASTATTTLTALTVNAGTLDLNGKSQDIGTLSSVNPNASNTRIITSTGGLADLSEWTLTTSTYSGQINGTINFARGGNSTLTLAGQNGYTGTTSVLGGTLTLRDQGSLATSNITLVYGTMIYDQSGLNPVGSPNPTRLTNAAVPIHLHGGNFTLQSGGSSDASATLSSPVALEMGANTIAANVGTGTTAVLALGSLNHNEVTSTINFSGTSLGNPTGFVARIRFAVSPNPNIQALTEKIIGPWAVTNSTNWATVKGSSAPFDIGELGNTGGGFLGYDGTDITSTTTQTFWNVNESGTTSRTLSTSKTVNTLRSAPNAGVTLTIADGVQLTVGDGVSGGWLVNNNTTYTVASGGPTASLTSGGSELYMFVNQSTLAVSVKIKDGPTSLSLIKSGAGVLDLRAPNTYTGQTVVNQGTLQLNLSAANGATNTSIKGDLVINAATVSLSSSNQIVETASVAFNGPGTLNLSGTNTLARLTFTNPGGATNPTVNTSNELRLSAADAITSDNSSQATTPFIAGTSLKLTNAAPVINTTGTGATDLLINAPIHNKAPNAGGPITKTGTGTLALNPNVVISGTTNGTTASPSPLLTVATDGLEVGMAVTGTNIPANTTIALITGPTQLVLSTSPTATATANMTFSGSTFTQGMIVQNGALILGNSSSIDGSSNVLSGPVGKGTLTLQNGAALLSDGTVRTLHNAVSITGANVTFGLPVGSTSTAGPGAGVILAGQVDLSAGPHAIDVNDELNVATITGKINGAGVNGVDSSLTKVGSGTLVLSNATNAFGGPVTVQEGVLRVGAPGAVPSGVAVSLPNQGAIFDMNGTVQTLSTLTGLGAVASNATASPSLLRIGENNASSNFGGSISGVGNTAAAIGLTKIGTGTFTLSGLNTYGGQTNVDAGTLAIASGGSVTARDVFTIKAGATGRVDGTLAAAGSGLVEVLGDVPDGSGTLSGSGLLKINVNIEPLAVIHPTPSGGNQMRIEDGNLTLTDGSTFLYAANPANNGGIVFNDFFSTLDLATGAGWKLKLENTGVVNPGTMTFVLFDARESGATLFSNSNGTDLVGNWTVDFGNTGWTFNPNLGGLNRGIHYDFNSNSIVLRGVIPEPNTTSMLFGGLAVALGLQRFRRRHRA